MHLFPRHLRDILNRSSSHSGMRPTFMSADQSSRCTLDPADRANAIKQFALIFELRIEEIHCHRPRDLQIHAEYHSDVGVVVGIGEIGGIGDFRCGVVEDEERREEDRGENPRPCRLKSQYTKYTTNQTKHS